ncbi:hypothetical protein LTR17_011315 [Elasticomyces elasticus]|nr:hypothetical protein LTR17_011315 [Elasticomyces elasticus]
MLLHLRLLFIASLQVLLARVHARGLPNSVRDDIARWREGIDQGLVWSPNLQDDGDNEGGVISCMALCDLDTCSSCSAGSARRSVEPNNDFGITSNGSNECRELEWTTEKLQKRVFRLGATGNTYLDPSVKSAYTLDRVAPYMVGQLRSTPSLDRQYGAMRYTATQNPDTEAAVSQQQAFSTAAFQFGSAGLHGCTMVAVMSRRGCWMAHFWESYSNGKSGEEQDSVPNRVFQERVIDFLTGTAVNAPENPPSSVDFTNMTPDQKKVYQGIWKDYLTPVGPPIDPNLFNRPMTRGYNKNQPITPENYPGDDTRIYVMTPAVDNAKKSYTPPKYPNRVKLITDTIKNIVEGTSGRVPVVVYNYIRLDYSSAADAAQINKNERGMALFQYDPNADGKGLPKWRLFYEGKLTANPSPLAPS